MEIEAWLPVGKCPICEKRVIIPVVDVGFGISNGDQVGPGKCEMCAYIVPGCQAEVCLEDRCATWDYCFGQALDKKEVENDL